MDRLTQLRDKILADIDLLDQAVHGFNHDHVHSSTEVILPIKTFFHQQVEKRYQEILKGE